MVQFHSFRGNVIDIQDIGTEDYGEGCTKMIVLQNEEGTQVHFILMPSTYVVNQDVLMIGDTVTGYYDASVPVIAIYPPQYVALVMVKEHAHRHVKVSYFDSELISQDGQLKLNLQPFTQITTANGQAFSRSVIGRNLVVIYGSSTKSIPAQTIPYRVIVLC